MKHLLIQYIDMVKEKKEIQHRINMLNTKLEQINKGENGKDTVKGGEGGWQTFHIEGFPVADEDEARYLLSKNIRLLRQREHDIAEKVIEVEAYLNSLNDSRMRRMITKKYIEGKTWYKVADEMGKNYSPESCQKQVERFFKKI